MSTFTYYLHDYTDVHDVDEDVRAITIQSGYWSHGTNAGAAYRSLNDAPDNALDTVASVKKK